jgi:hypothetical protein
LWSYNGVNNVDRDISRHRAREEMLSDAVSIERITYSNDKLMPTNSILPQRMISEPCSDTKLIGQVDIQKAVIDSRSHRFPLTFNWLDS